MTKFSQSFRNRRLFKKKNGKPEKGQKIRINVWIFWTLWKKSKRPKRVLTVIILKRKLIFAHTWNFKNEFWKRIIFHLCPKWLKCKINLHDPSLFILLNILFHDRQQVSAFILCFFPIYFHYSDTEWIFFFVFSFWKLVT